MASFKVPPPSVTPTPTAQSDAPETHSSRADSLKSGLLRKLRGGALVVLGYLLSPLCWWNDLIFNLPVAYGFGYLCSLIHPSWLLPGAIAGYWLSNVVGILLMQAGVVDFTQADQQVRDFRKELRNGLITSTVYTIVILGLLKLGFLDTPLSSETLSQIANDTFTNLTSILSIDRLGAS